MFLDIVCIISAVLVQILSESVVRDFIEEKIIGRYLNLSKTEKPTKNMACSVLNDEKVIDIVFNNGEINMKKEDIESILKKDN